MDSTPGRRTEGLYAAFEVGGEMGRLMAEFDWASTSVGPIETWPQSLVSSLSILLASKAQIVMFWGPDYLAFYNDAYAPTIGDKHPHALGRSARIYWSELWDTLEPLLAGVRDSGEAFAGSDYPFTIERRGFPEDVFFDISYDPIRVEDGSVGGVFCIVSETTLRVLNERRLELLAAINAGMADATDSVSVVKRFADALGGERPDIPFVRLVLPEGRGDVLSQNVDLGVVPADLPLPDADAHTIEDLQIDGKTVALALPLRASAVDVGSIVLGVNERYELDADYRRFLSFAAFRFASGLVNARLHESDQHIAATLQRAILPDEAIDLPGFDIAGVYLPATAGVEVGGDWYDALPLPDGRAALIIGDVAGKGVQAAALMGQLRNALRAYLVEGHGPADALRRLNRLVLHLESQQFATVLCAVVDPFSGALTWATAGHPPPLLIQPDGSPDYVECPAGPPIGVADQPDFTDCPLELAPGSTLVLFTDGLVEDRQHDIDVGFTAVVDAVRGLHSGAEIVRRLSRLRSARERSDDIAILAACREA